MFSPLVIPTSKKFRRLLKVLMALTLVACFSSPSKSDGASIGGGSTGGGAPNVRTVSPTRMNNNTFVSSNAYQLGRGQYPVTPSIVQSNRAAGNSYTGLMLDTKTNITIEGVHGQTVINGESEFGELLLITNCYDLKFRGLTFRGRFTNNYVVVPYIGAGLWGGVMISRSAKITFQDCIFEYHQDHGIWDDASSSTVVPMSTNQILLVNCDFRVIGSTRTNGAGGITKDGTAIVPTGWTIRGCRFENVLRGIEPYTDGSGANQVFYNFAASDCEFRNVVDFAIGPAGSTNTHYGLIDNCIAINDRTFTYQGTNYGFGGVPSPSVAFQINGGRGWMIRNSSARGSFYIGFYLANTASLLDDSTLLDCTVDSIDRGDNLGFGYFIGDGANTALAAAAVRRLMMANCFAFNTVQSGFRIASARDSTFSGLYSSRGQLYGSPIAPSTSHFWIGTAGNTTGTLTNNVLQDCTANDLFYGSPFGFGIEPNVVALTLDNFQVLNFSSAANGALTNRAGNNVIVRGRPISTMITWDIASTLAAGQFQTNLAMIGVTTNFDISITPFSHVYKQGAGTNFAHFGWGSNGVAYVTFHNIGNVTANPAAADFVITATQRRIQGN